MTITYHNNPVSVWHISKEGQQPDWVKTAFAENKLVWLDNRLQILKAGLEPPIPALHKLDTNGLFVGGGIDAHGVYAYGEVGDYLDATNQRVVSAKRFEKHYTMDKLKEPPLTSMSAAVLVSLLVVRCGLG